MDEIIQKLHKIRQLALQGKGGEKTNAKRILKKLLKQYGLQYEEVFQEQQEKTWATFTYTDQYQKQLLFQCYFKVASNSEGRYKQVTDSRIAFYLTAWESLELAHTWKHYRKLWKQQLEDLLCVFIEKYDLHSPDSKPEDIKEKEYTLEELEKIQRQINLYKGMQEDNFVSTRRMLDVKEEEG